MEQETTAQSDLEFAKHFENFVNGSMSSAEKTGNAMANAHPYLQSQMFNVCIAYIRRLAVNYREGRYDPRNERAARLSSIAYEALIEADEVYEPDYNTTNTPN